MGFRDIAFIALCIIGSTSLTAEVDNAELGRMALGPVADLAVSPGVLLQNLETAALSQSNIDELDAAWRAATNSGGDIIDQVAANSLCQHLSEVKKETMGRFIEVNVTNIGVPNVGIDDVTSNFWQDDEAKWQVPHDTFDFPIREVQSR